MELRSPEMKLGIEYGSHHRFRARATSWCFLQLHGLFYVVCLVYCNTFVKYVSFFLLVDQVVDPDVRFARQKEI